MLKNLKEFNLPQLEEKVLEDWKSKQVFEKLEKSKKKKTFRFYEGPPYANGLPAIHHILSRIFKDIILRYKTMTGYSVPRQAGWDTHGLPIELQVEKELGIRNKKEIDKLGVAIFNRKAREIIWRYLDKWEKFTERIGYWLDLKNPYITCDNSYIESLWWIFKRIYGRGYLKESRKIVPYCPRCETPLSSHELGQPGVYKLTKDPSVYVKFKLKTKTKSRQIKPKPNEYLLVWTTTPWTLPANVAVAIDPQLTYTKYKIGREYLWTYNSPPKLSSRAQIVEKISGKKLIGLEYEPLYKTIDFNEVKKSTKAKVYKVVAADFVKTDEGTGLVHIAPAFGEDDFNLLGKIEFPVTINNEGKVIKSANWQIPGGGKFIKDADKNISADLKKRKLLYFEDQVEHEYPFCWRCYAPLIYFARKSWFFEVSRLRKQLITSNETINWIPDYIKNGRFGEWIKEAKDWSISRERYWGTPLPIWRCDDCKDIKVIGSLEELDKNTFHKNKFFIMRHGEANHNLTNLIASGPEKGENIARLTETGKEQALKAAGELKKKKIDIIFTSPYKRTVDTAKIIADKLNISVVKDKRLREVNCGMFNWRKIGEHKKFFRAPIEEFTKAPPAGETLNEVKRRMFEFIKDINQRYEGRNILVVSHGDPLWILEAVSKNLSNKESLELSCIATGEWQEVNFKNYPYNEDGEVDVHRPYIDDVYLKCSCGGSMKRVLDVADVWFDSGAMPFASAHYPFENKNFIDKGGGYPANFIAEGIDQTRGWFYTLLAVSVLLGMEAPYKNVISLGLIRDKYGQKMSKSKGNIIDPWAVMDKYGVDTVRWYFYTINPPAEPKDFDEGELAQTLRRFFFILYNSYVFYETVNIQGVKRKEKHIMDRWIESRLNETIKNVTDSLESYEIGTAARSIEELVDDLSRWYIRRSRKRPEMKQTLGPVLLHISKLIAPFAPFFGEALYQSLKTKSDNSVSVHLSDWPASPDASQGGPKPKKSLINRKLLDDMSEVRKIATLVLAERSKLGIKVRQPLAALRIKTENQGLKRQKDLLDVLKDEVNVKKIIFDNSIKEYVELDTIITQELREEGILREFTRLVQNLRRKGGLKPKDKIALYIETKEAVEVVLGKHSKSFGKEVGASSIDFKHTDKFDAEFSGRVDSSSVWIALRKM